MINWRKGTDGTGSRVWEGGGGVSLETENCQAARVVNLDAARLSVLVRISLFSLSGNYMQLLIGFFFLVAVTTIMFPNPG